MLNHPKMKLALWQKILIGLILGVAVGLIFKEKAVYLKPVGDIFLNAIRMMVIPLIFTAVVCAMLSLSSGQKMFRVGMKGISIYATTTFIAATMSLTIATLLAPGAGLDLGAYLTGGNNVVLEDPPSLISAFVNIIPANPATAFAEGNILQIVVFALILGLSINLAGAPAEPAANFFKGLLPAVFKLCLLIMRFAPYGVFALIATVTGEFGLQVLLPLLKLLGVIWLVCFLQWMLYGIALFIFTRLNPLIFYKAAVNVITFAFTTISSAATVPLSIKTAEEKLGVKKEYANFLLPVGASINLDGLSIYLGAVAVFAANIYGVELTMSQYVIIATTVVLTSMGAGGLPGTGIIVMGAVLASVGLPLEVIAIIAAIDRFSDMINTVTNVLGDLFTTSVVAYSENALDVEIYNSNKNKISS